LANFSGTGGGKCIEGGNSYPCPYYNYSLHGNTSKPWQHRIYRTYDTFAVSNSWYVWINETMPHPIERLMIEAPSYNKYFNGDNVSNQTFETTYPHAISFQRYRVDIIGYNVFFFLPPTVNFPPAPLNMSLQWIGGPIYEALDVMVQSYCNDHTPTDDEIAIAGEEFGLQIDYEGFDRSSYFVTAFYQPFDTKGNWTKEIMYFSSDIHAENKNSWYYWMKKSLLGGYVPIPQNKAGSD